MLWLGNNTNHKLCPIGDRCITSLVGCKAPQEGSIKINIESLNRITGVATCGGVFRNEVGAWLGGFSRNLAELWGILTALQLAWDKGIKRILLERDSTISVQFTTKGLPPSHPYGPIVSHIARLLQQDWMVHISHTYREANGVADWLAGNTHLHPRGLHVFDSPPTGCYWILWQDLTGLQVCRRILMS